MLLQFIIFIAFNMFDTAVAQLNAKMEVSLKMLQL